MYGPVLQTKTMQLNTKSCQGTDLNTEIQRFVDQQMI